MTIHSVLTQFTMDVRQRAQMVNLLYNFISMDCIVDTLRQVCATGNLPNTEISTYNYPNAGENCDIKGEIVPYGETRTIYTDSGFDCKQICSCGSTPTGRPHCRISCY